MKQPPDYTLPLPDEFNISKITKFLKAFGRNTRWAIEEKSGCTTFNDVAFK